MRRARTIVGLPVISLAEGLRLGEIRDIVFDPDRRRIAGLVITEATWRRDAEIVPIDRVRSFGRDAVTIHSLEGLIKAKTDQDLYRLLTSGVKVDGLLAMTEGGNYLGIMEEIVVGPRGEMIAYEISAGFAEDLNRGKCLIPADEAVTVGKDVATFPDGVESLIVRQLADLPRDDAAKAPLDTPVLQPVNGASG
jgi:uncharacterized protein YrrD